MLVTVSTHTEHSNNNNTHRTQYNSNTHCTNNNILYIITHSSRGHSRLIPWSGAPSEQQTQKATERKGGERGWDEREREMRGERGWEGGMRGGR